MAFPQVQTTSLDTITSTSLQNYLPDMEVNVVTSTPALKYLLDEQSRRTQGGTRINAQLLYGFNSTTTAYNLSDYIDLAPQEAVTAAQYKWANIVSAVTIFGEEEMANAGDAKIQDFVQSKIMQAELSIRRYMNAAVYGDGTGAFGANPDGLANLVFATTTPADPAGGAVGGISAVTYPFWRNNANTTAGLSYASFGSMGTSAPDHQLRMYHLCTDGSIKPTLLLSDYSVYESYHQNAAAHYRVMETAKMDLGFEHVMYKGTPWAPDFDCPTGFQYFLNTQFLYGVVDENRFFKATDWLNTLNQDAKVMRIHMRYNIICTNRMNQGVISGWVA